MCINSTTANLTVDYVYIDYNYEYESLKKMIEKGFEIESSRIRTFLHTYMLEV